MKEIEIGEYGRTNKGRIFIFAWLEYANGKRDESQVILIENGKLTETYIKYLWVRNMTGNEANTIYIPTEAGLPILEANK